MAKDKKSNQDKGKGAAKPKPAPSQAAPESAKAATKPDANAEHRAKALADVRKLSQEVETLATATCDRIEKGSDAKATGEFDALKQAGTALLSAINRLGLHAAPKGERGPKAAKASAAAEEPEQTEAASDEPGV